MAKKATNPEVSPEVSDGSGNRSGASTKAPVKSIPEATSSNGPAADVDAETAELESPDLESPAETPGIEREPEGERVEEPQEPTIESLLADRERLTQEKEELFARLQRVQAEFENTRKRLEREREEAQEYAAMGVIESLLPIIDDFERALQSPSIDPKFREGLELIYKRIFEVFTRAGLQPIEIEDGEFNPHLHHAVDRAPAEDDKQDNKIVEVYQKGYLFKDRLLRASLVKVAVKE